MLDIQSPAVGQRSVIQNAGDGFAHIQHHLAHFTFVLIAIVAGAIVGLAGAGDRRKRAIERTDDVADGDLVGRAGEAEAAALAFAAQNETGIAKLGENIVEKLARYMVLFGDLAGGNQLSIGNARQMYHGFQAIFALFGQHATPVGHFLEVPKSALSGNARKEYATHAASQNRRRSQHQAKACSLEVRR